MDMNAVIIALNEIENFKKVLPALRAEHEALQRSVEKVKELYAVERKAYEEARNERISFVTALEGQKQAFLAEKAAATKEIASLRENAEAIYQAARREKADLDMEKRQFEVDKAAHGAAAEKLRQDVALLTEAIKKIV